MADSGYHVPLEMRRTALEPGSRELLAHNHIQAGEAVCNHQSDAFNTTAADVVKHGPPAGGAFQRVVVDAKYFASAFFCHGQNHIERLCSSLLLPKHLDVDAVHEHDGIVCIQTAMKPHVHFLPDIINHSGDARLAVVLSVDLVEHLTYLTLRQALRIEASSQLLALLFLVPKDGQDLRMEVAETVPGYPELKFSTMTVGVPQAKTVTLVVILLFV